MYSALQTRPQRNSSERARCARASHRVRPGMGATSGQIALSAGQVGASTATQIAVATGAIGGPVGIAIGAGIALAGLAIQAIMNSGCGQTCIVSTQFANQANDALQKNIAAYFAIPAPRPLSAQRAALANFDQLWNWLGQQCSNAQLGAAGQRCITDRQQGACTWHQSADTVPPWGTPAAGACWNWFNGYRDPIANDPNVYDDSQVLLSSSASGSLPSVNVGGLAISPAMIAGALLLLAAVVIL
jgi:hypothetical protein